MTAAPVVLTKDLAHYLIEIVLSQPDSNSAADYVCAYHAICDIASGAMVCKVADEWQSMFTVPDCDDELWFCRGDTFEGPRPPRMDDVDYWDWWCYAEPPILPSMRAAAK